MTGMMDDLSRKDVTGNAVVEDAAPWAKAYAELAKAVGRAGFDINSKDGGIYLTPKDSAPAGDETWAEKCKRGYFDAPVSAPAGDVSVGVDVADGVCAVAVRQGDTIIHISKHPLNWPEALPDFLRWAADELVRRDNISGSFMEGLADSLRGRAYILREAFPTRWPMTGAKDASVFDRATVSAPAGSGEVDPDSDAAFTLKMLEKLTCNGKAELMDDDGNLWGVDQIAQQAIKIIRWAILRKLQQGADYVMVPREPTDDMVWAGRDAWTAAHDAMKAGESRMPMTETWRAMLRAASQDQQGDK